MIKHLFTLTVAVCFLSCDLNVFPEDSMTQDNLTTQKEGAEYATLGNYAMFKDILTFEGSENSANSYIRHFFQMAEFPGDNTTLSGRTSDPLYESSTYLHFPKMRNTTYLWWVSYKIIYGTNVAIESIPEGASDEQNQLKGENYFLRALIHFDLSRFFSKPYIQGREQMGVVLRTSSISSAPQRATVGAVYDQIVMDLENAIRLMNRDKGPAFASKQAAWALLSRVHLYMGNNDKVIDCAEEVFKIKPLSHLEPDLPNYFANALESTETLFAIKNMIADSRGQSSIASMYLNDGTGWGEVYASFPYLQSLYRNSNDLRRSFIKPQYVEKIDVRTKSIAYGVVGDKGMFIEKHIPVVFNNLLNKYEYEEAGAKKTVEKDSKGFDYILLNGQTQHVLLDSPMEERFNYSKYFVTKFSYQDGDPMLSSPVILRLAEVLLNRAEAYAKKGESDKALADINKIRERAGLFGNQLFSATNMQGYTSVEEIVADERQLELAFEGHRAFDVFRNNKSLDRRFPGVHMGVVIEPSNKRIINFIPENEIMVSGLPQND